MSQSPSEPNQSRANDAYHKAWAAVNLMVRQGRSWSGHERNCCFLNTRGERFATISAVSGLDKLDDSRALAVVDWDLDGRLDLWVTNRTSPRVRFYHNETPVGGNFLALKLRGVTCNRDAIGARLELHLGEAGKQKRIKTLRAGEGFLAQSSKWVHFGLADETKIERLVVHWPGGKKEQFTGLEPNRRYLVTQGQGQAEPWPKPVRSVTLARSNPRVPPSSQQARIVVATRLPIPGLTYTDFEGRSTSLFGSTDGARKRPVLVNLWASWCRPCIEELDELAANEDRLRAAGLDVIALSVDGLEENSTTSATQAEQTIKRLGFPFAAGVATAEVVAALDAVHRGLVDLPQELPLPSSFLIDATGRLVVLYKGPLAVDQLLDDVQLVNVDSRRLRDAAVPFAGSWITEPINPYPQEIALKFAEQGRPTQAVQYLQNYIRSRRRSSAQDEGGADLADIHFLLGRLLLDQKKTTEAMSAYGEAVRINPRYRKAHVDLGDLLMKQNEPARAAVHFAAALKVEPSDADTLVALGVARILLRQVEAAVGHYRDAIRVQPSHALARSNLARVLQARGKTAEAAQHYRYVLRAGSDSPSDASNLAWILATTDKPELRNVAKAIQWAERACEATKRRDPRFLTTLAVAYSEARRFNEAIATVKAAIEVAKATRQAKLVAFAQRHLRYYEAGQSYRQGRQAKR